MRVKTKAKQSMHIWILHSQFKGYGELNKIDVNGRKHTMCIFYKFYLIYSGMLVVF